MSFLRAKRKYLHRRFIGVHHIVLQHHFTQRIDQRLQLHTASADPLGQG